ncbi:nucleotide exchange factor GrpE [Desulfuribacillus alkaliarsenatis]|uniref:Protein GrpE n=1 Tax=Desulfuribacillus alkaliarsenatis TaxID=766136 RepID=A0A1E5G076_9FIRM|nr:nucleotide exchange factor GrpE [Desulfuribacillus alkaliarsenatis]OEF96237.1 nucleotide exchange factor GrpE [Desulfuribacillus alkaliarsenatis]
MQDLKEEQVKENEEANSVSSECSEDNQSSTDDESKTDSNRDSESSYNETDSKIDELEQKLKDQEEKFLRLQADFDNFRKRSQKERQSVIARANKELLLSILPIVDNLERAIASSANPDDAFTKGVNMVYNQLMDELNKQGVTTIEAVNQEFDPNYHQAVAKEAADGVDSNIVIQEFQKGYLLHEEVLRPSMVKVSE